MALDAIPCLRRNQVHRFRQGIGRRAHIACHPCNRPALCGSQPAGQFSRDPFYPPLMSGEIVGYQDKMPGQIVQSTGKSPPARTTCEESINRRSLERRALKNSTRPAMRIRRKKCRQAPRKARPSGPEFE
jgi:hypothetical protein